MKKSKELLLILLSFILGGTIFAQDSPNLPDKNGVTYKLPKNISIIAPSAAGLGKYGAYPVSKSTGVPQINIPIYEVISGDLKLPISLSYHASGIKVSDDASWVGLGWSLNAGGAISVSKNGAADSFTSFNNVPSAESIRGEWNNNQSHLTYKHSIYEKMISDKDQAFSYKPDVYTYNLNGISGSFVRGKDGNFKQMPKTGLKIDLLLDGITGMDGTKYFFDKKSIYDYTTVNNNNGYKSAYYLQKILSVNQKDVINLDYTSNGYINNIWTWTYSKREVQIVAESRGTDRSRKKEIITDWEKQSKIRTETKRLKTILFKNGKVEFTVSKRYDICGTLDKLDCIKVYRKEVSGKYKLYKNYNLTYSYFGGIPNVLLEKNKENRNNRSLRLRLDKVVETTSNIVIAEMKYKEIDLPMKNSCSVDFWGYYNGQSNSSLRPKYPKVISSNNDSGKDNKLIVNNPNKDPNDISNITNTPLGPAPDDNGDGGYTGKGVPINDLGDADRNASERMMSACIIKSIKNPLKGITEFEFEMNTHYDNNLKKNIGIGGLRIKGIKNYDTNGSYINGKMFKYCTLGSPEQSSAGVVRILDSYDYYITYIRDVIVEIVGIGIPIYTQREHKILSSTSMWGMNGNYVSYKSVLEYDINKDMDINKSMLEYNLEDYENINGCISSEYKFITDSGDHMRSIPNISRAWGRGQKLKEIYYKIKDGKYIALKLNSYKYKSDEVSEEEIKGLAIEYRYNLNMNYGNDVSKNSNVRLNDVYNVSNYTYQSKWIYLDSETNINYNENGENGVINTINYEYDKSNFSLPTKIRSINSKGNSNLVVREYPKIHTMDIISNQDEKNVYLNEISILANKNILTIPLKQERYVNGRLINGQFIRYNVNGNPISVYRCKNHLNKSYREGAICLNDVLSNYELYCEYTYNSYGKLKEVKLNTSGSTCYLWGYDHSYVVAKINNVKYSEIEKVLGLNINLGFSGLTFDQEANLRLKLPNSNITTYTYKPLIGITSIIDSNGISTLYNYNNSGRLESIVDNGKNKLKSFKYNFSNKKK